MFLTRGTVNRWRDARTNCPVGVDLPDPLADLCPIARDPSTLVFGVRTEPGLVDVAEEDHGVLAADALFVCHVARVAA